MSEAQLHEYINNIVNEELQNEISWNQLKQGAATMFGSGNGGAMDRIRKTGKNWTAQGEIDNMNKLKQQLQSFIEQGEITPDMTIGQLMGGKFQKGNFASRTGQRQAMINARGGKKF